MLCSVSPVDIVQQRPGFGQLVHPVCGSIVASPVPGAYDPNPDYFFHWYRDAALVIDALRLLYASGTIENEAISHLADFVRFNLSLQTLDGRRLGIESSRRTNVREDFHRFLRTDEDLGAVYGDAILAEARVNPDASLDISRWPRPQHDGAPLTALTLLRWTRAASFDDHLSAAISSLIRTHLDFTSRHWSEPCYDIWEEEKRQHYYTQRVSAAALIEGADWLKCQGEHELAARYAAQVQTIYRRLEQFWCADAGHYRSRILESGQRSGKELDIAVILATTHADAGSGPHSAADPQLQATLAQLEHRFDADYAINHHRPAGTGTAMGRYPGDVYYSGGAYYFSTLGAAEFCFHAALTGGDAKTWIARGDAYLTTVRRYTPATGALSEQFDQTSGAQTSAPDLAWSYAAFISCITARRQCMGHRAHGLVTG